MSNPAMAIGNSPTGVSTEKRPPTLSAMTKVLYPSVSASLRNAPFFASVMAMIRCLASSFPTCASSCSFNNRKAMAGSVVVPDFEMTTIPKDLFFRRVCSSNK